MADVGMNLAPNQYFGTEFPFIDRMKTSNGWSAYGVSAPVDANGNPTAIPTGYSLLQTLVALDPVSAAPTDVYELTYSGTATFQVPGATVISSQPGKLVFKWTNTTSTMANVVLRSIDSTDPVHDIHIVRQDNVAAFAQGELFNPEFLAQVSNWQTLRFMDWGNINNTTVTSWEDRPHVTDATWQDGVGAKGVPIEVMIQLANEAKTDMWFNIPTQADDTYVRNALQLIKDRLAPGLKVHVEYSNEVWNTGFQQTKYAQDMANKLWGKDVNKDGVIDGSNPAEAVEGGNNVYYGYRSAQIAAIANSVFSGADDSRLEMVFSTQNGNNTLEKYLFDGIARANVGSVSSLFDEWSVTSYFGLEMSGLTAADRTKVLGWANSGAAGLDAAFQELAHGGAGMDVAYSIDDVAKYLKYEKTIADRYGLDLVGYEGGFHGSALYYGTDQATVMDFFARLMADPRMEDLYKYWFDTFSNAGGDMLAAYYDVRQPSNAGVFGTLNSLYDAKTPRYNALLSEAAPKDMSGSVDRSAILFDLFSKRPLVTLLQTAGAQDQQITALYQTYGGRAATAGEVVAWRDVLGSSQNYGMVKDAILASSLGSFYVDQQITAAYQTYGGRAPTANELAAWEGAIGGSQNYGMVKDGILSSSLGHYYIDQQIVAAYQTYGGRAPTSAEISAWEGAIGGSQNYGMVKDGILSSSLGHYYIDQQIVAAYQTYGGRAPTSAEISAWEGAIGGSQNYGMVKNGILNSSLGKAYLDAQITTAYQTFGGRGPVGNEMKAWESVFSANGFDPSIMRHVILSSPIGQAYTYAQINSAYQTYGGRAAGGNELQAWQAVLNANGHDFSVVRDGVLSSSLGQAYMDAQITSAYKTYGGRAPGSNELRAWEDVLNGNGHDFSVVRDAILNSSFGDANSTVQIAGLYQRYFGRMASPDEQATWHAAIRDGADFDMVRDSLMSDSQSAATTTQVSGTSGFDAFRFDGKPYMTITGFDPAHDAIDLMGMGYSGINPLDAAHARDIHQADGTTDVFITLDATHEILLHNVSVAQLGSSDFML